MSFPALVEPADELTIDEVRRYSRHLIIPDVGMTGQKRLKNAKVLVIGAGGLGSPALLYLAAAGVGHAGDRGVRRGRRVQPAAPDHPRPVRHREVQGGLGPGVHRRGQPLRRGDPPRGAPRQRQRPVGLRGLRPDRRRHRQLRDPLHGQRRGVLLEDPLRLGLDLPLRRPGVGLLADRARARDAPCYRCLYPEPPPPGMVPSCAEGGVLGVLCAAIGSIQVNEAIKVLTGIGDPAVGKLVIYDALELEWRKLQGAQGPQLRAVRRQPHRHRADRLRDLLRGDLRRGGRRRGRAPRSRSSSSSTCSRSATRAPATSCSSTCASPTSTRSTRSPARC